MRKPDCLNFTFYPALLFMSSLSLCHPSWAATDITMVSDQPAIEAFGDSSVRITLGQVATEDIHLRLITEPGTATSGRDFIPLDLEVTLPIGATETTVRVPLVSDAIAEDKETFTVHLESLTPGYTVATEQIEIIIQDDIPAGLDAQDAQNLTVLNLCLDSISKAGSFTDVTNCSNSVPANIAINYNEPDVAVIEIDLAAECSPTAVLCPEQSDNWLIDFVLQRVANGTTPVEQLLGSYIYPAGAIQREFEGPDDEPERIYLALPESLQGFLTKAFSNGQQLRLEARIRAQSGLTELAATPSIVPFPGTLLAGDAEMPLRVTINDNQINIVISSVQQGDGQTCPADSLEVVASSSPNLPTDTLCVRPEQLADGRLVTRLVDGSLALAFTVLPPDHQQHLLANDGNLSPFNISQQITLGLFDVIAKDVLLLDTNNPATKTWLHKDGWPFMLRLVGGSATIKGIKIQYDNIRYLQALDYSSQDPRSSGQQLFSNDAFFSDIAGASGELFLGDNGFTGAIPVPGGNLATAWPKAQIKWQAFLQQMQDSELVSTSDIELSNYTLEQGANCKEAQCSSGATITYHASVANLKLDRNGFSLAPAKVETVESGWGAQKDGSLSFRRPDDLNQPGIETANLAIAGYRIAERRKLSGNPLLNGTPLGVDEDLQAHLQLADTATGQLARYRLGTSQASDGNHFPIGLSVGPEIYRNAAGTIDVLGGQDLSGNTLVINDQKTTQVLTTNIGSKYVIRNAGITGVFNAIKSDLSLSGYPLQLDRFGIRLRDNLLDSFNWIDGALALHGDAGGVPGLRLQFSNLSLSCDARFGAANLLLESCDGTDNNANGVIDENCDHRLSAWKADTDILSMNFTSPPACTIADQLLSLEHQIDFKALNKPVNMIANWSATGTLSSSQMAVADSYRLDRSSDEDPGFAMRASGASLDIAELGNEGYGWLAFNQSKIAVPFWQALSTDVRIANTLLTGVSVAEPSVVAAANQLASFDKKQTNGDLQQKFITGSDSLEDVSARYVWGNTGFDFELPVYYSPKSFNGELSHFLGRQLSADLFVMDANAGINFIDPDRTKLSFGASADLDKLTNLSFQIDLSDPENLGDVDDLLESLGIISRPVLQPAYNDLQDQLNVVNKLANQGLDQAMQKGLESSLEIAASGVGVDPFVIASEGLALIQSLPAQATALLKEEIMQPVKAVLADAESRLRAPLADLSAQLLAVNIDANAAVPAPAELDDAISVLTDVDRTLSSTANLIETSIDETKALVQQLAGPVQAATTALDSIDDLLQETVNFTKSVCEDRTLNGSEIESYVSQILQQLDSAKNILDIFSTSDLLTPVVDLIANNLEFTRRMEQTEDDLKTQAAELDAFLTRADAAIRSAVCDPAINTVLDQARGFTETLRMSLADVDSVVASLLPVLDGVSLVFNNSILVTHKSLNEIQMQLEGIKQQYFDRELSASISGSAILDEINASISTLSNGTINVLSAADNSAEVDFPEFVASQIQPGIDVVFTLLENRIVELSPQLPGAYFTPQQLRRELVQKILQSSPVASLRTTMNQHFSAINRQINSIALLLFDQLNFGIREAIATVESEVNDALSGATAAVKNIPLQSVGIDGFATIAGNELERAHIGAEWTMKAPADGEEGNTFAAALDVVSWSVNDKASGCNVEGASSRLDATISAMGLPANVAGSDIVLQKVYLGFNLASSASGDLAVRGVYGGLKVQGDINFSEAKIYDPAFAAGIGDIETYIGASAGAVFSDIQAEAAFLVGRTCNDGVLTELDPEVAKFIPLPPGGFAGVYFRGGASIPIISFGCPLTVGVGAEFGTWVLASPLTVGGLIGGGAYGKVLCVGGLRGQLKLLGQVSSNGDYFFAGSGFGAAGVGFCEPSEWTSIKRSRDDGWCATGDAVIEATFDGDWTVPFPSLDGIF